MIQKILILVFVFSSTVLFSQNKDFKTIEKLLAVQSESWNKGDIDGFMQTYWKSEELQFIGSSGVVYGWQGTLDRYKRTYPDKATMGHLTFNLINVDKRSRKVISVVGKWHLKRDEKKGDLEGHFLLILKKIKGKWLIVADHSS